MTIVTSLPVGTGSSTTTYLLDGSGATINQIGNRLTFVQSAKWTSTVHFFFPSNFCTTTYIGSGTGVSPPQSPATITLGASGPGTDPPTDYGIVAGGGSYPGRIISECPPPFGTTVQDVQWDACGFVLDPPEPLPDGINTTRLTGTKHIPESGLCWSGNASHTLTWSLQRGAVDNDQDGVPDVEDNCDPSDGPPGDRIIPGPGGELRVPATWNPDQADADGDGRGDICDSTTTDDLDQDGIADDLDNCPSVANADQLNFDGDLLGDVCDDDIDDDGLPNWVELEIGTSSFDTDSDDDTSSDGDEFAAGSDPTDPLSSPATLPTGLPPGGVAQGGVGVTCGVAKFDWYTSIGTTRAGVQEGEQACILLLGNDVSLQALTEALSAAGSPLTTVLADLTAPWLKAQALDLLIPDLNFDLSIPWPVRWAIIRQLNLTRFNTFFTLGELVGLTGAGLLAATIITEITSHDACIQVTLGPNGSSLGLDWNLVFNNLRVTSNSDYTAGTHQKKVRPFRPDTYEKRLSNLACVGGSVWAQGGVGVLFNDNYPVLTNVG